MRKNLIKKITSWDFLFSGQYQPEKRKILIGPACIKLSQTGFIGIFLFSGWWLLTPVSRPKDKRLGTTSLQQVETADLRTTVQKAEADAFRPGSTARPAKQQKNGGAGHRGARQKLAAHDSHLTFVAEERPPPGCHPSQRSIHPSSQNPYSLRSALPEVNPP